MDLCPVIITRLPRKFPRGVSTASTYIWRTSVRARSAPFCTFQTVFAPSKSFSLLSIYGRFTPTWSKCPLPASFGQDHPTALKTWEWVHAGVPFTRTDFVLHRRKYGGDNRGFCTVIPNHGKACLQTATTRTSASPFPNPRSGSGTPRFV